MSGLKQQKTSNLFDPVTGAYVGVIDLNGNETFVPTYNPITGAQSAGSVAINIIAKIKAAIAGAAQNNPVELAPWNAAPAWVTGTGYGYGQVLSNANNDYIVTDTAGGTSGASAPTGTSPNVVNDGTLNLLYLGGHEAALPAYDAPVVTYSATLTGLTRSVSFNASGVPNPVFSYGGGLPFINGSNLLMIASSFTGTGGNLSGWGGTFGTAAYNQQQSYIEFMTDAPKIGIAQLNQINQSTPMAIEVDGRRVQPGSLVPGSNIGGGGNTILDWSGSAAKGRRARRIRARFYGSTLGVNVNLDTLSSVWAVRNANRYRFFAEGDSLEVGAAATGTNKGGVAAGISLGEQFANLIGCDDFISGGIGGTGFVNAGSFNTYVTRLPFLISCAPDVVGIFGNFNDAGQGTSASRQQAIITYLQALRAGLPRALIFVWGPWPTNVSGVTTTTWPANPAANATTLVTADADMQIATAAAGVGAFFYSLINDPAGSWCYGTGKSSSTTGNGNADLYVSGSDGVHPTQQGTDYQARRYANAFKQMASSM